MGMRDSIASDLADRWLNTRVTDALCMRDALSFTRGSAALYALFATLAKHGGPGEVVIPALCCETVALAAVYAGLEPRFADVSSESLCVTPDTIAPLMSSRTRAVLVVHLFGIDADIPRFDALRRAFPTVAFIEDIAQAVGGRDRDGQLLGGGMDYALLSFADSKIVAGDGGMLLFGADALERAEIAAAIPATAPRILSSGLALSLRNFTHGLADLKRARPGAKIDLAFRAVIENYRDLIVCSGGIADRTHVAAAFADLEPIRANRYQKYRLYRDGISVPRARVVPLHEKSTCWRCPVLFDTPKEAQHATSALRAAGILASNHYFPLNLLLGGQSQPVAEEISGRIVNLWTDALASPSMIEAATNMINRVAA
jgi:dTDP-4-amino-4,6-dideoxygalactose transaminase